MRNIVLIILVSLLIFGCGKAKFKTEPQVTFKSIKPTYVESSIVRGDPSIPKLTVGVTDGNGDLGFNAGKDTSYIYVKNLLTTKLDSFLLPNLSSAAGKNFEADIEVSLFNVLGGSNRPRPHTDTLFFEVYVTDFAKNKSNVIVTTDTPLYYFSP
ncbi:MAG: hypothetical protein QM791_10075 [Ferruginibacter sp.]